MNSKRSTQRILKEMLLLLIYCLMNFPLFVGRMCLSLFCNALLCVHSSFVIILKRKRKLVDLLLLSYRCRVTVNVLRLFLTVPWVGLQCVNMVFPDHTHLLSCNNNQVNSIHVHVPSLVALSHYLIDWVRTEQGVI